MIKHFKFWLIVASAFFFVACGDSDSGTSGDASALLEGKTFYSMDEGDTTYEIISFNDGTFESKSYDSLNQVEDVDTAEYTFSGDKLILTFSEDSDTMIVSSISNGVKAVNDRDSSEVHYLYNTLEDAKANNGSGTSTDASALLEGKTFYTLDEGDSDYRVESFNNGTFESKKYSLSDNQFLNESSPMTYTISGDKLTINFLDNGNSDTLIISSISNGVKGVNTDGSEVHYLYNTLEDAKANPNENRNI